MTPDLDRVLAEDYLDGMTARPIGDVRRMRTECQALENGLSYVRRLVQGRLDIVGSELQNRREDGVTDLRSLVERLPEILGDQQGGSGLGMAPLELEPAVVGQIQRRVDEVVEVGRLATPEDLDDDDLAEIVDRLAEIEERISAERHRLHEVIDLIRSEITRRYRTGEADVESLLKD